MPHKIGLAITCLHISAAIYLLIGIAVGLFGVAFRAEMESQDFVLVWTLLGIVVGFIAVIEVTAWGLQQRKFWAWVVGLIIFALYVPSLFIPLGVLGLIGLLNDASRREFGMATARELD